MLLPRRNASEIRGPKHGARDETCRMRQLARQEQPPPQTPRHAALFRGSLNQLAKRADPSRLAVILREGSMWTKVDVFQTGNGKFMITESASVVPEPGCCSALRSPALG